MKEFLIELLQAVATAAVPVCAAFLVQFLRRKSAQIGAEIDSLDMKELLAEVTEAVTTAVTYTSQTYVDALKKGGIFDKEAQLEALRKSKDKTLSLLSVSAKKGPGGHLRRSGRLPGNQNRGGSSGTEAAGRCYYPGGTLHC